MNPILPQRVEKIKGGSAIDHGGNRLISLTFGSRECGFLYCNSIPLGAAWAYYIKVLVLASTAS